MQSNLMHMNSGLNVDVFDLKLPDIKISDIAHHLSLQCRFIGACKQHYSVAQHSIMVALRIYMLTHDSIRTRKALLHDGSEAYLGDVARPIKCTPMFELYRNVEDQIQRRIWLAFGISPDSDDDITDADNQMLSLECTALFNPPLVSQHALPATEVDWTCKMPSWDWRVARKTFIEVYNHPEELDKYTDYISPRRH